MHTYLCSFLWIKPILMIRNEVRVAAACRWRETRVLCQKAKRDDDPPSRVVIKRIIKRILSAIRSSGRSIVFGRSFVRSIGWESNCERRDGEHVRYASWITDKVEREREAASYADRVTCGATCRPPRLGRFPLRIYMILRIACENRFRVIQWEKFTLANRFVALRNYTRGR